MSYTHCWFVWVFYEFVPHTLLTFLSLSKTFCQKTDVWSVHWNRNCIAPFLRCSRPLDFQVVRKQPFLFSQALQWELSERSSIDVCLNYLCIVGHFSKCNWSLSPQKFWSATTYGSAFINKKVWNRSRRSICNTLTSFFVFLHFEHSPVHIYSCAFNIRLYG